MAKEHESVLGAVLSAGLESFPGYEQALEAMGNQEEEAKLEHRLSYMALSVRCRQWSVFSVRCTA